MSFEVGIDTKISKRINHHGDTFLMFSDRDDGQKEAEFSIDTYEAGTVNILGIIACLDGCASRDEYIDRMRENEEIIHDRTTFGGFSPVRTAEMWLTQIPWRDMYEWSLITNHGTTNFHYDNVPDKFYIERSKDDDMERIDVSTQRIPHIVALISECEPSCIADEYYASARAIQLALVDAWSK